MVAGSAESADSGLRLRRHIGRPKGINDGTSADQVS
jgi:hypothetical protein